MIELPGCDSARAVNKLSGRARSKVKMGESQNFLYKYYHFVIVSKNCNRVDLDFVLEISYKFNYVSQSTSFFANFRKNAEQEKSSEKQNMLFSSPLNHATFIFDGVWP